MSYYRLNNKIKEQFKLNSNIKEQFRLNPKIKEQFRLNFNYVEHETDPATGKTYLFEGGYFRRDGIFTKTGAFKRR